MKKPTKTVFWNSLRLNFVIVLVITASLALLSVEMRTTMRSTELKTSTAALNNGMGQLTEQLQNVNDAVFALRDALAADGKKTIQRYDANALNDARTRISTIALRNSLVADIVLIYEQEDLVVTANDVYSSIDDFLTLYTVEGMDPTLFKNYAQGSNHLAMIRYLSCQSIRRWGREAIDTAFCYAIPLNNQSFSTNRGVAYVFMNRDALLNMLVPDNIRGYASILLYNNHMEQGNNQLMSYSAPGFVEAKSFQTELVNVMGTLRVTAQIANRYLDDALDTVNHYVAVILIVTLLTGIGTAFWSSYRQNLPMRQIIRQLSERGLLVSADKNEYRGLLDSVETLMSEKETVAKQLGSYQASLFDNMLDRLFSSTVPHPEVEETIRMELEDFPDKSLIYYGKMLISVADSSHSVDLTLMMVIEYLRQHLPKNAVLHSTDTMTFGLIYPFDTSIEASERQLSALLSEVQKHFSVQVLAVLGGCCEGLSQIGSCYERAQLSYYASSERRAPKQLILQPDEPLAEDEGLRMRSLQAMYQFMAAGDSENAVAALETFFTCPTDTQLMDIRDRYTALRVQILLACREVTPTDEVPNIPTFRMCNSAESQLQCLSAAVRQVCAQVAGRQSAVRDDQFNTLMDYLNEHYSDPSLCAAALADEFRVSEKYLFSLFKKKTGYSPISYLHHVRMEKAVELLRTSELTVQQISEQVGFSNFGTFHKAFKREYGMAPSKYRDAMAAYVH